VKPASDLHNWYWLAS